MLELKKYAYTELSELLETRGVQGLHRKLNGYGVKHAVEGRGKRATFTIKAISDPFKIFCITELHFPAQTDFDKLQDFYYWLFNDDEFMILPDEVKETRMRKCGYGPSRQTIASYTRKLMAINWIRRDADNCFYYFAYKNKRRITSREKYNQAWHEYWYEIDASGNSGYALSNMIHDYGGIARKQKIIEVNGIYNDKINYMQDLILERMETKNNTKIE